MKDFFQLGQIRKPHGLNGELNFFIDSDTPQHYLGIDFIFLEENGQKVPYKLEAIKYSGKNFYIKIKGVENALEASSFSSKDVFLPLELLPAIEDETKFYFHEIIGFKAIDEAKGEFGIIQNVLEYPNQVLLQIVFNNKEILLPINDEFIKLVDRKERKLFTKTPEGLIDLYLE
jgi:16S rRNA processing protein RimM